MFSPMDMDKPLLDRVLQALGDVLEARGLTYELVVVGGSSLLLLGLLERPTRDLDALAIIEDGAYVRAEPFPLPLAQAVASVGRAFRLSEDWLNPGPTDLLRFGLPEGFRERTTLRRFGALTLHIAGRFDQVCFKLYAAVDQGPRSRHLQDLDELGPDRDELLTAARWSITYDPSPGYRSVLVETLRRLGLEDADAWLA